MASTDAPTTEEIRLAIAEIQRLRPAYAEILGFYAQVFAAQLASEHHVSREALSLSKERIAEKFTEGFPLISCDQFVIDCDAGTSLLDSLCRLAEKANPTMAKTARSIGEAVEVGNLAIETLFEKLVAENGQPWEALAHGIGADPKVIAFFTYNSVKPSILNCSHHLEEFIPEQAEWARGYCPICGSAAGLSTITGEGGRTLICHFCWHQWTVKRIFCPVCGNQEQKLLGYFYSDQEPEYRVDTCKKCHSYLKTVDTRQTARNLYLPLERAATLHLDLMAQEHGFAQPPYRV